MNNQHQASVGTGPVLQGKVNSNMANSFLHSGVGARLARVGAIAASLALGVVCAVNVGLPSTASAQAKKTPDKKAAAPRSGPESAWVKLCDKGTLTAKDKDGKEEKKEINICMTHHERIDANSGMLILSAALHNTKLDGKDTNHLRVMVPLGMLLPAGMRATVFPKDVWDKVVKNEKLEKTDEGKVKTLKLTYTHCHQVGCVAEVDATPELLTSLKTNAGLRVFTIGLSGAPIGFDVPLVGFDKALAGPPVDTKKYAEARKQLMQQIAHRQQELREELKKQQENLNKMQPNVKPAPAPPAKK
jgi:invasion protein IalB